MGILSVFCRLRIHYLFTFSVVLITLVSLNLYKASCASADRMDSYQIGAHGQASVKYPSWFKDSFYDLQQDLDDAAKAGKRGVILFVSQKSCNHCQAFLDTTLGDAGIRQRVQKNYDVIGLDIFNDLELTDVDASVTTIRDFAERQRARLTPTLLFYSVDKIQLLKIIGFYPPEKFNRVLDYIESGQYKSLKLSEYLRNTQMPVEHASTAIAVDPALFGKPPYNLDRRTQPGKRPLLVVFDSPDCNPCRRFHQRVLEDADVRKLMKNFDAVLIDSTDNKTRITLPDGKQNSPRQWAEELQLVYDVAVVFFDINGKEVHRLDAETGKDRMTGSMQYVLEQAYKRHEQFLRWRREKGIKSDKPV